ncbi:hypothetical protein, conserved [Eimeria brunetti]|uniref:Uncharacterized protein n=1 Tax=Eimeria brunetti TaxID=51314 RepID=U6L8Y8_9EIME|nr:hypothetical protein, conserved [Eimeria brunetti]
MMDAFFRFFSLVAVVILGAGASTQRHFSVIRIACIAVDVVIPLLTSGDAAHLEVQMANPNSSSQPSGAGTSAEMHRHEQSASDDQQRDQQPPQEPSAANSAAHVGEEKDANQVALDDLRQHGTQMSKTERKQAEDYLRAKYGVPNPQEPADASEEAR